MRSINVPTRSDLPSLLDEEMDKLLGKIAELIAEEAKPNGEPKTLFLEICKDLPDLFLELLFNDDAPETRDQAEESLLLAIPTPADSNNTRLYQAYIFMIIAQAAIDKNEPPSRYFYYAAQNFYLIQNFGRALTLNYHAAAYEKDLFLRAEVASLSLTFFAKIKENNPACHDFDVKIRELEAATQVVPGAPSATQVVPGAPPVPFTQVVPGMPSVPFTQVVPGMPSVPFYFNIFYV